MANDRYAGIALILVGGWFLLPLVSDVELPIREWWPLILVGIGVASALSGNVRGGLVVIAVGVGFLLFYLDVLGPEVASYWPVALIAVGVAMLFGYRGFGTNRASADDEEINVASLFSENNRTAASDRFRGGNVSATFGSAEIDLRNAEAADGAATVNASVLSGSVRLRVPSDWAVDVRSSATWGSIESQRSEPSEPRATLTVTGSCLFGGIVITS